MNSRRLEYGIGADRSSPSETQESCQIGARFERKASMPSPASRASMLRVMTSRRCEAGILGGDREISGSDELAPGRRGNAVNFGNDRLWQCHDLLHQSAALGEGFFVGFAARIAAQLAQIVPGAESRPGTR